MLEAIDLPYSLTSTMPQFYTSHSKLSASQPKLIQTITLVEPELQIDLADSNSVSYKLMIMHKSTPSLFQQVFFTVVAFTLLSGGGAISIASQPELTPEQSRILETLDTTWKIGIGTIFGLLGSQTPTLLNPKHETDEDEANESHS